MEDSRELIKKAQRGDDEAMGDLVKMHYLRVYRILYGIVRNEEDAKELGQITWVKVWQKLHTFKGNASFTTWVYRIATFTAWDFLRKQKRSVVTEYIEEQHPSLAVSAHNLEPRRQLEHQEVREQFQSALQSLPEKQRTALVLREVEGFSYDEIAKIMKCKVGTVMSRIFNARKSIQAIMKKVK